MTFRLGAVIGFGVGYYFGAKAGQERYLQLRSLLDRLEPMERVQSAFELAQQRLRPAQPTPGLSVVVPPSPN